MTPHRIVAVCLFLAAVLFGALVSWAMAARGVPLFLRCVVTFGMGWSFGRPVARLWFKR
jgi:hypothetical protein